MVCQMASWDISAHIFASFSFSLTKPLACWQHLTSTCKTGSRSYMCVFINHASLLPHGETPDRTESETSDAEMPAVLFPVNLLQAATEAEKTTLCEP